MLPPSLALLLPHLPEPEPEAAATTPNLEGRAANRLAPELQSLDLKALELQALEPLETLNLDDSYAWSLPMDEEALTLYGASPNESRTIETSNPRKDAASAESEARPWNNPIDPGIAATQYALYASLTMPTGARPHRTRPQRPQRKCRAAQTLPESPARGPIESLEAIPPTPSPTDSK